MRFILGLSKKKKILLFGVTGVFALSVLILITRSILGIVLQTNPEKKEYTTYTLKESAPLVFKGRVNVANEEIYYADASLGKLEKVVVKDGQEVKKGTPLFTYVNEDQKENIEKEKSETNRLTQELSFQQEDLQNIQQKKSLAENKQADEKKQLLALQNKKVKGEEQAKVEAQIEATKAKIEQLEQEIESFKDTLRTSDRELFRLKEQLKNSKKSVEEQGKKIKTTVKAKSEGIVLLADKKGNAPEKPLLQIVAKKTKVIGEVSEYDYHQLHLNDEVRIKTLSDSEEVKGKINKIEKVPKETPADSLVSSYSFEVLPEKFIHYGFNVEILLHQGFLTIPKTSLVEENGEEFVFVHEKGKARKQKVETSKVDGEIYVRSGLVKKQQIIEVVDKTLRDGQEVMT